MFEKIKNDIRDYSAMGKYKYVINNIDTILIDISDQDELSNNVIKITIKTMLEKYKIDNDYRKICAFLHIIGFIEDSKCMMEFFIDI
ncbi:MAG: hypothetical protein ACRCXT_11375 [Paraclostridium sp.]